MSQQQPQDRRWEVNLLADEFGDPLHRQFDEDVQTAMAEAAVILLRLGGAIQSYVIRAEDPDTGMWFATKAVFKWQSFVPGIRAARANVQQAAAAPEPEIDLSVEYEQAQAEIVEEQLADDDVIDAGVVEPDDDDVDGQVYEKGGEQRVAESAAEQQELLRDGWKPVARV